MSWDKRIKRAGYAARGVRIHDPSLHEDISQEILAGLIVNDGSQTFGQRAIDATRRIFGDTRSKNWWVKNPLGLESECPVPDRQTIQAEISLIGSQIDPVLWTVFVLREAHGYTWVEIGFAMGSSHVTARHRHNRAKLALLDIVYKTENQSG